MAWWPGVVANRSLERAQALAEEFKGTAVPLDERFNAMAEADVVISSTGSEQTVISRKTLAPVMQARGQRPLVIIDIAVPRDVDPDVAEIEGVHLHDIDALQSTVDQTLGRWKKDLEVCEQIIATEMELLIEHFKTRQAAEHARRSEAKPAMAV